MILSQGTKEMKTSKRSCVRTRYKKGVDRIRIRFNNRTNKLLLYSTICGIICTENVRHLQ
jgi:hypothetical protein